MNTNQTASRRSGLGIWMLVPAIAALVGVGAVPRFLARTHAAAAAADNALATVRVVHPGPAPASAVLRLPATLQPWAEASIRARSSGYVASWSADIGAHVRAGQTLATVVAPELSDAVRQANDEQVAAQAAYDLAQTSAARWEQLLRANSTSLQEAQQKQAEAQTARARLSAAKDNVIRIGRQLAYTTIVAPFDGVITARGVDVGTLVDGGAAPELFHIVQTSKLRVVLSVPDDQATAVRAGLPAQVLAGGQVLQTTVARSSASLDPSSRMLRVEADLPNGDGALLPGTYAQVQLNPPGLAAGSALPIEAVLYRPQGPVIALVNDAGRVTLQSVQITEDLGSQVVVSPALPPRANVIANPGDSIEAGSRVRLQGSGQTEASPTTARHGATS